MTKRIIIMCFCIASNFVFSDTVPITNIMVFASADYSNVLSRDGAWHVDHAIDGDVSSKSFLTISHNMYKAVVALDCFDSYFINRFRVSKFQSDTDDLGDVDPMSLRIMYTTDTGPLNQRTYQPVTGMINGINGSESINAAQVNQDGTITGDTHDPADGEFWSVSFDTIQATGIAMEFDNEAGEFVHYPVAEFQVIPAPLVSRIHMITNNTLHLEVIVPATNIWYNTTLFESLTNSTSGILHTNAFMADIFTNSITIPVIGSKGFIIVEADNW